ncbi:acyl-CoA reductase-like NAD-dependent aldehyde dehydrogenase [Gordonia humi]|uniref:Acyl-CoA reductase-like NAD-dependent aldehyde dehydrogenase n=1 Tax=Gordonia humi TaxID=686429 RepID=A0A840EY85_9ACTN|nr:acyl-CoA reductase-like NAD-dependent aldehyde dehydrogenase [Gordonia humi]
MVALYRYTDIDDAVALANATPYGLNASVWSRDGADARALATRLRAGTVNVNEAFAAAWGSVDAPMGGMGDSGLGRRHGAGGLLKYTDAQNVAQQRLRSLQPPADTSAERWAAILIRSLNAFKTLGLR